MYGGHFNTFSWALERLRENKAVARMSWAPREYVNLETPTRVEVLDQPYFVRHTRDGYRAAWIPTTEDLLAADWGLR